MTIGKAIITAAGRNQRHLPLQLLVDRDGQEKSALRIIIDEILSAGIDEICIVVCPGDEAGYRAAAGVHAAHLHFVQQAEPFGYGHALVQAEPFVKEESFLHIVSDHLFLSTAPKSCAQQLVAIAEAESCSVSAVQASRENMLPHYGVIGGRRLAGAERLYDVERVLEKPTPTEAEQTLNVPGLRAGHYLCFFGMHVLSHGIMSLLREAVEQSDGTQNVQLSPSLDRLAAQERFLAYEAQGRRYNIGMKYGKLISQLALGLDGKDREEILAQLLELLATRERPCP